MEPLKSPTSKLAELEMDDINEKQQNNMGWNNNDADDDMTLFLPSITTEDARGTNINNSNIIDDDNDDIYLPTTSNKKTKNKNKNEALSVSRPNTRQSTSTR